MVFPAFFLFQNHEEDIYPKLDTYLHAHYISTAFTFNFLTNDIYTGIHFVLRIFDNVLLYDEKCVSDISLLTFSVLVWIPISDFEYILLSTLLTLGISASLSTVIWVSRPCLPALLLLVSILVMQSEHRSKSQ